ncbi:MAG: alpha/beta hydrolase [Solirubrobacterales bacterium]
MESRRADIRGPGGRRIEAHLAGPEDGRAVIFHTGTPDAGMVYRTMVEDGAERGLRHVTYCRPGYGDSDRDEGRRVADCAADVAAVADALGLERFHTVGASGGGPHALASAALLGERVISAATMAGVAPHDAEGLDWLEGMGQKNHDEFGAAFAGTEPLRNYLDLEVEGMRGISGAEVREAFGDLLSEVDRAVLSGEFAEHVAEGCRAAIASGIWGWFDDDMAFIDRWGFDPGAIEVPVTIWQGAEDRFVPFAHGQWLAENVSGARARLPADEGHLSIVLRRYGDVLDDLLAAI